MLNKDKLKCELSLVCANNNFSGISNISKLLKFINENRLDETFFEVSKLLQIALVSPISTADSEKLQHNEANKNVSSKHHVARQTEQSRLPVDKQGVHQQNQRLQLQSHQHFCADKGPKS